MLGHLAYDPLSFNGAMAADKRALHTFAGIIKRIDHDRTSGQICGDDYRQERGVVVTSMNTRWLFLI